MQHRSVPRETVRFSGRVTISTRQTTVTVYSPFENCKRLQGAADARRRAGRRTHVLQVPANAAGAVACERLQKTKQGEIK